MVVKVCHTVHYISDGLKSILFENLKGKLKQMTKWRKNRIIGYMVYVVIILCFLFVFRDQIKKLINWKITDVTHMVNMDKEQLEQELGVTFKSNPAMVSKIYECSDAVFTVESDEDAHISVIYTNGVRSGLHIDNTKYEMFGLYIGGREVDMVDEIRFEYDDYFEVLNDAFDGTSTGYFFCNTEKNNSK